MQDRVQDRRLFLKTLGLAALGPFLGGTATALAAPSGAAAAGVRATALPGGMYLVNGWILTAGDLEALGIDAA